MAKFEVGEWEFNSHGGNYWGKTERGHYSLVVVRPVMTSPWWVIGSEHAEGTLTKDGFRFTRIFPDPQQAAEVDVADHVEVDDVCLEEVYEVWVRYAIDDGVSSSDWETYRTDFDTAEEAWGWIDAQKTSKHYPRFYEGADWAVMKIRPEQIARP